MNKKITLIATLAAASLSMAAFPDVLWDPSAPAIKGSPHKVCAGYSDEELNEGKCTYADEAGWWFDYNDQGGTTKGNSYVAPVGGVPDEEYNSFMASNILANENKAIAVEFTNLAGYAYPFSGIGFKLDQDGDAKDLSSEEGLCFVYKSSGNFTIEFESKAISDDGHYMQQFEKGEGTAEVIFNKTTQPTWAKEVSFATAFGQIVQIKFKRGNDDGGVGTTRLQLSQIAKPGKCTASPYTSTQEVNKTNPVLNVQSASSVKMQLASRTLSFAGLRSAADVQVINFQGQVVRSATLSGSKSLNLSSLDNGVYLVRVAGQDLSFSQKIVLK